MNNIKPLLKLLADTSNSALNQTVRNDVQLALNGITNELMENLEDLKAKSRFINDLKRQNCEYYSIVDEDLGKIDNQKALERILMKNNRHSHILCSNDILNNKNPSKLDALLRQLTSPKVRCVYADFSYSSFKLPDTILLPSNYVPKPTTSPPPDHEIINYTSPWRN
jgi:hypothetical protein